MACSFVSFVASLANVCMCLIYYCIHNTELRRWVHGPELQGFCAVVLCQLKRGRKGPACDHLTLLLPCGGWESFLHCDGTLMFATEKSCQRFRVAVFPFVEMKNDYCWCVGGCSLVRVLMDKEYQGSQALSIQSLLITCFQCFIFRCSIFKHFEIQKYLLFCPVKRKPMLWHSMTLSFYSYIKYVLLRIM